MTKVEELYDIFLSKISDYSFISMSRTDSEVDEELMGYLKAAVRKFQRKCKQDLSFTVDEDGDDAFVSTLSYEEEDVLVAIMLVEYLKPQVLSSDTIRQRMSDKDFQVYSQANHLREIGLIYRQFRAEARVLIQDYGFSDIEDWSI